MITHKKILIGITGGIAAYKSGELVRLCRKAGAEVRVVMTEAATSFISPLTFQALSGHPVAYDLFDAQGAAMEHIELARWPDLIVIAPASANFIARITYGHANDLLSSLCLATQTPIVIAPAMNQQMWKNSITQQNIRLIKERGYFIIDPASGEQACGDIGPGRLVEPDVIKNWIENYFSPKSSLQKKILITAGPTQEEIDPMRFLSNYSSGKMGYALAEAAKEAGAEVTLISGPTKLPFPSNITFIPVKSAQEMHEAVMSRVQDVDVFISAAAVADYRPENRASQKIKKLDDLNLKLIRNPDILFEVSQLNKKPLLIGFAAETESLIDHAYEKLKKKNLDIIIANKVGKNQGFGSDYNQVTVINQSGETRELPLMHKKELAIQIIALLEELLNPINIEKLKSFY